MTTFTTEDRILAEKDGSFTVNVEPIPFAGLVTLREPKMNNEPVAWMHHCLKSGIGYLSYTKPAPLDDYKPIPLYTQDQLEEARKLGMQQERALWNLAESTQEIMDTHPVKEKGLPRSSPSPMNQAYLTRSDNYISDEVIEQLAKQFGVVGLHEDAGLYEFARAILRKAQEK